MPAAKFNRGRGKKQSCRDKSLPVSSRRLATFSFSHDEERAREVFDDHRLTSKVRGESEVEELALRIQDRKDERITITSDVTKRLLKTCQGIAKEKGYPVTKIRFSDLLVFRDEVKQEHHLPHAWFDSIWKIFGFRSHSEQLLHCLERAIDTVKKGGDVEWFYFMDFHIYYTRMESRWPWMRSQAAISFVGIFIFYLFSPIFFCLIVQDSGVCPSDPTGTRAYHGWMSSLYFASTTLSTVGYGDLHITHADTWKVFAGIVYMILCNVMLIVAFSAAADSSTTIFTRFNDWVLHWVWGNNESELLHKKLRRVTFLRLGQIVCTFFLLNFIGVFVSRIFVVYAEEEGEKWTWMTSLYWAVQTTTTIGYGDLEMGFNLRWFQIFYLILSTYFVGNALGGLASLKDEIHEIKEYAAWDRRELSKGLIEELQPYDHDDKIDQYEFVLASLVTLGKVGYNDVVPIMDKFRSMSGDDGFITACAERIEDAIEFKEHEKEYDPSNNLSS